MNERNRYRAEVITCSNCGKRERKDSATLLDDKPWCYGCYDELEHGAARRICRERGYHVVSGTCWDGSSCGTVSCECNARKALQIETEIFDAGGFNGKRAKWPKTWPHESAESVDAVDPSAADPGTPPTREGSV